MTSVWSVIRTFLPERRYSLTHCFRCYKLFFDKLCRTRGRANALKVLKAIAHAGRNVVMDYDTKARFRKNPYLRSFSDFNLRTYRDGFPRCLKPIHRLLKSRKKVLKLCGVSILSAYMVIRIAPDEDTKVITSPFSGLSEDGNPRLRSFIEWFVPVFIKGKISNIISDIIENPPIFAGFKSGSYGSPSISYSVEDARTLLLPEYDEYCRSLCYIWSYFRGGRPDDYLDILNISSGSSLRWMGRTPGKIPRHIMGILPQLSSNVVLRLARLCFLSDRGGKTRIITSGNYYLQYVLNHIHEVFMRLLSTLQTDYTYDQDRSSRTIKRWQRLGYKLYSFDMTSATDRFPLKLQRFIMDSILPDLSEKWEILMGIPVLNKGEFVKFSVGQPMGLLSSWPVFAFSHHIIVRYCAWECGLSPFTFDLYCLLGDDIVIAHSRVASLYKRIMCKVLGIQISSLKSYIPRADSQNCAEFAKRNYVNGQEVSPLAPDMLAKARSEDPLLLVEIIQRIVLNWNVRTTDTSDFIRSLFLRVLASKDRVAVTRYMFLPSNLHPLLYRIKGVREHSKLVYPPAEVFSVVAQRMVEDPFNYYNSATSLVKYEQLSKSTDFLLGEVEDKMLTLLAQFHKVASRYSRTWDRGLFPYRPAYNKIMEFYKALPMIKTIDEVLQSGQSAVMPSLSKRYVHLVWALQYLKGKELSHLGIWHAKRVFEKDFIFDNYQRIIDMNIKRCDERRSLPIHQLFLRCPGEQFSKEFEFSAER